ncbi:hypothetical protein CEP54_013096 [Fusarium duplospermum]|uniref:Xylanolytic transcriptional activator regulatory domain-containing protein n=1 Tax=Fusarium duplospermum TaxID=1325734 RepID=A0A428P4W5_9HYPO|nr:hypothetical protein CEP54_013096 [Fusarium duplospermum]
MREIETLRRRVKELEAQLEGTNTESKDTRKYHACADNDDQASSPYPCNEDGIHLDATEPAEPSSSRAQFYGQSSAYYFIHRINLHLQSHHQESPEVQSPQKLIPNSASRSFVHAVFSQEAEPEIGVGSEAVPERPQRLTESTLSGKNLTATQEAFFLDLFWDSWHCCYQILDQAEFEAHYKSLWGDPGQTTRKPSAMVDIVLALCMQFGVTSLPRQVESKAEIDIRDATIAGRWLYRRAQALLAYELERPSLTTLQCQFWSAVYLGNASYQNMAQGMIGTAICTAHALGLHVEPSTELPLTEREARKQMWWTLFVFETRLCIRLGRPWGTEMSRATCSLPVEDQETRTGHVAWRSYTVQRARLMLLFRAAFEKFHQKCASIKKGNSDLIVEECSKTLQTGMDEIHAWADTVPTTLKTERRENGIPFSTDLSEVDIEAFAPLWLRRQRLMLELGYHDSLLTLGRSCIAFSLKVAREPYHQGVHVDEIPSKVSTMLLVAESAAQHAISITHLLHQIYRDYDILDGWYEPFNYQWNAAITLVGFILAYSKNSSMIPTACEALSKSIEVLERMGSFFGVAASAAGVVKNLLYKANAVVHGSEDFVTNSAEECSVDLSKAPLGQLESIQPSDLDIASSILAGADGTFGPASELEGFGFSHDLHQFSGIGELGFEDNFDLWMYPLDS